MGGRSILVIVQIEKHGRVCGGGKSSARVAGGWGDVSCRDVEGAKFGAAAVTPSRVRMVLGERQDEG